MRTNLGELRGAHNPMRLTKLHVIKIKREKKTLREGGLFRVRACSCGQPTHTAYRVRVIAYSKGSKVL